MSNTAQKEELLSACDSTIRKTGKQPLIPELTLYRQLLETSMGTRMAPSYADTVMAYIDKQIMNIAAKFGDGVFPILFFKCVSINSYFFNPTLVGLLSYQLL